jgi:hypothetical protein
MEIPHITEVQEYFKNAKVVRCLSSNEKVNISEKISKQIHSVFNKYWIDLFDYNGESVLLWSKSKGYAEIIEYIDPIEEREIVGYELIKPQYLRAICAILDKNLSKKDIEKNLKREVEGILVDEILETLKDAGVLEKWFKPIYKEVDEIDREVEMVLKEIELINGQFTHHKPFIKEIITAYKELKK